jgi:TolA-binding protein
LNAIVGVEALPAFQLTLDEQRALYTLYLTRPNVSELQQRNLDAMRRASSTPDGCAKAAAEDRRARELWRAEKIRKLGAIDPSYPTMYALGIAYFRAGSYDQASDAFRSWIDAHPDGPWTNRARNHLKASLAAYGSI